MGLDGTGWDWMGLDGTGWDWMGLDGTGWDWRSPGAELSVPRANVDLTWLVEGGGGLER
jgi:hypothetical protein